MDWKMNEEILAELKKLNANMEKLLCFQKLAAQHYADKYRTAMGSAPGPSQLERETRVPGTSVPDYGANGMSADASVRERTLYSRDDHSG